MAICTRCHGSGLLHFVHVCIYCGGAGFIDEDCNFVPSAGEDERDAPTLADMVDLHFQKLSQHLKEKQNELR